MSSGSDISLTGAYGTYGNEATASSTGTAGTTAASGSTSAQGSNATDPTQKKDTVKISVNAQIKQMSQNGQSDKQIAANLGVTTAQVELALGESTEATLEAAASLAAK